MRRATRATTLDHLLTTEPLDQRLHLVFIRCISLSHIFSIEFPLVILRLLDSLKSEMDSVESILRSVHSRGKIWPRGGCRSGRLCVQSCTSRPFFIFILRWTRCRLINQPRQPLRCSSTCRSGLACRRGPRSSSYCTCIAPCFPYQSSTACIPYLVAGHSSCIACTRPDW